MSPGRPQARARAVGADPPADRPRPRGLHPAGRRGSGERLGRPRPLLRHRGRGDAAHPGRGRPAPEGQEARRRRPRPSQPVA
jgi:hypothetical protein